MTESEYQFRNPLSLTLPSAHVPGEECGNEREASSGGQIRHRDQPIQHAPVHLVRGRLEVRPGQEEPDRVETTRGDPCEIGCDLLAIEV